MALRKPHGIAQRVAVRLQIPIQAGLHEDWVRGVVSVKSSLLMTVIDATLQLHPGWEYSYQLGAVDSWTPPEWDEALAKLEMLLIEGASLYEIDIDQHCLRRRVSAEAQTSFNIAVKEAPAAAADHLRTALKAAYGLQPDPDKVFSEAIRAIEEVACPLVEGRRAEAGKATLGSVIGQLKTAGHRWELVLPASDGAPRDVESLVGMMQTIWQAQQSRHGGGPNSRRMTQKEASAAVHLAVLVQWLSTDVLRKKP